MEGEPTPERTNGHGELPATIQLKPWRDEVVEEHGFGPRHMYVECCWLPVLGPTATWLYRRLGSWAEYNPEGVQIDLNNMALSMGLGEGLGHNSKLSKALGRLVRFEAARFGGGELQVRTALPPLPLRALKSLDDNTRRLHDKYMSPIRHDMQGRLK